MAETDIEILRVLQKRARLARQVREVGAESAPLTLPDEKQISHALAASGVFDLPREVARAVLREVHAATASLERSAKVAFMRPEGGYAQVAVRTQFGESAQLVAADTVPSCLDEVTRRRCDYAVIPIESSHKGPIHESLEELAATDLLIVAKIEVPAVLSLMRSAGDEADFDTIYAFPRHRVAAQRALALRSGVVVEEAASPLAAARSVLDRPRSAAILPQATGEQMGLSLVQSNVGDCADLRLRFGVVSARPTWRSGDDMTALLFGAHDEPGALFDALKHFSERGINLKSIQSRPMPGHPWTYQFYVEVSGHVTDRSLVTALDAIKRETRFVKVLGSFPAC